MERMPDFGFEYRRKRDSLAEKLLGLSEREFERNFGFPDVSVVRFQYTPERGTFRQVADREQAKGPEVLFHRETSTLVVPPPTPGSISIRDLAKMSLPVVDFINQEQPDIVIGCDRGARMYALAVHSMWHNVKAKEQRFPTLDSKLHFARLSTSLGIDITSEALRIIMKKSIDQAKRTGKFFNIDKPKILFIDDWVYSGATRQHILDSLDQLGVLSKMSVRFAVMCGPGADASGSKQRMSVPWHDNAAVIGVNYTKDGYPYPVRTDQARDIRRKVHRATKELAEKIRGTRS